VKERLKIVIFESTFKGRLHRRSLGRIDNKFQTEGAAERKKREPKITFCRKTLKIEATV